MVLYDFHTHTFHSDGVLSPIELIRRAFVVGYAAIAIADHIGIGSLGRVIKEISDDCALARAYWDILAIPISNLAALSTSLCIDTIRLDLRCNHGKSSTC